MRTRRLQVTNSSAVSLQNVTAGSHGGGFCAIGEVEIAGRQSRFPTVELKPKMEEVLTLTRA